MLKCWKFCVLKAVQFVLHIQSIELNPTQIQKRCRPESEYFSEKLHSALIFIQCSSEWYYHILLCKKSKFKVVFWMGFKFWWERKAKTKKRWIQDRFSSCEYIFKIRCVRSILDKLQAPFLDDSCHCENFFNSFVMCLEFHIKESPSFTC